MSNTGMFGHWLGSQVNRDKLEAPALRTGSEEVTHIQCFPLPSFLSSIKGKEREDGLSGEAVDFA